MKNRAVLVRLIVLGLSYTVCGLLCFGVHGMREWPPLLLGAGCFALCVSWFAALPWFGNAACGGYLIAFGIGCIFQTDGVDPGGGAAGNLWQIWTTAYAVLMALGLVTDLVRKNCTPHRK